jgi:phage terminase large subunit-like protein
LHQICARANFARRITISTEESADYTAAVAGEVAWENGQLAIYVLPNPTNKRMGFHDMRHSTKMSSEWFVEDTQYQHAAIEEMERRAFSVQGMRPIKDKRARLRVAARYIKNGTVKFPRKGAEQLITQLVGLGIEKHDDLCEACVWLILGLVRDAIEEQKVHYV